MIPGLAKEMPKISNGGKTYTLFLRPGLKYSDGTPVKASDFPFAVERMFKLNSGGSPFYTDIVGAEKFAETKTGRRSPGSRPTTRPAKSSINLEEPRGTFTNELGLMFVAPLPQDTPIEDLSADPPPGTGPYMITKSQPGQGWEYERNPYWAKANAKAMPDLPEGVVDSAKMTVDPQPADPGQRHRTGHVRLDAEPAAVRRATRKSKKNSKAPSSGSSRRSAPTTSG